MGWQEALKGISPRRFMRDAAENDWDYKTFIVKASQKGVMNSPNVLAYAQVLKEKQDLLLSETERERKRQESIGRRQEVSRVMGGQQAPEAIPEETRRITGVGAEEQIPTTYQGTELGDVWGDQPAHQVPEQGVQPIAQDRPTRGQVFGETDPNIIQTAQQFEEAGGKYVPTQADLNKLAIEKAKAAKVDKSDALGWANLHARLTGMEFQQVKALNYPVEKAIEKEVTQQFAIDQIDNEISSLQDEVTALEKSLPELQEEAADPTLYDDARAKAEKKVAEAEKKIEAKKGKFESKQKEWVSAKQRLLAMEEQTAEKEQGLKESLQKMGALKSDYAKSLKQAKQPATQRSRMPQGKPRITNAAEYHKLPSGTIYIDPTGKERKKP